MATDVASNTAEAESTFTILQPIGPEPQPEVVEPQPEAVVEPQPEAVVEGEGGYTAYGGGGCDAGGLGHALCSLLLLVPVLRRRGAGRRTVA